MLKTTLRTTILLSFLFAMLLTTAPLWSPGACHAL